MSMSRIRTEYHRS